MLKIILDLSDTLKIRKKKVEKGFAGDEKHEKNFSLLPNTTFYIKSTLIISRAPL